MIIVFTTAPNSEEAEGLAEKLVETKLAACVQVIPQMKSFYFWEGEVQNESECLLLIKTLKTNFPIIEKFIHKHHSYDVPEIVAVDSTHVSENYLSWVKGNLE